MITVSDADYRSHALPCYPDDPRQVRALVKEMESRIELLITDCDYAVADTAVADTAVADSLDLLLELPVAV